MFSRLRPEPTPTKKRCPSSSQQQNARSSPQTGFYRSALLRRRYIGRIPWPMGKLPPRGRQRFLILYDGLIDAVHQESASAFCHWCGVCMSTVWRWRKVLGVTGNNEVTLKLKSAVHARHLVDARAARPTLSSPAGEDRGLQARQAPSVRLFRAQPGHRQPLPLALPCRRAPSFGAASGPRPAG